MRNKREKQKVNLSKVVKTKVFKNRRKKEIQKEDEIEKEHGRPSQGIGS